MKINQNLGVLAPSVVRRKKGTSKRPPWYAEVPPDTIDIALLPRINRYERGGLKFHRFGSTQQKLADRIAIFQEHIADNPSSLALSQSTMKKNLEHIMMERLRIIEEAEQRSIERFKQIGTKTKEPAKEISTEEKIADQGDVINLKYQEEGSQMQELETILQSNEAQTLSSATKKNESTVTESSETESALEGIPTDWLIQRLNSVETSE